MGLDKISWDGDDYQVYPYTAEPRPHYIYDEDADGAFFVRNSDNQQNNTISEYVWVNYELKCPQPLKGNVFINGDFTLDRLDSSCLMDYDSEKQSYIASIFQKQGYYNYQFVCDNTEPAANLPSEGNFFQTENTYDALVYYKSPSDRTYRLVAHQKIKTSIK